MARIFSILFVLLFSLGAMAQRTTITGKVTLEDDPQPAVGAVVIVNAADSTKYNVRGRIAATDAEGNFKVYASDKQIELTFNYMGYEQLVYKVKMGDSYINLGNIKLRPTSKMVEKVTVVGQAAMSVVKEDTIQFNAAAFKTNPDATAEDLLKKMPGVTTDDDGNVEAQGEAIQKVYVNGKEFFEDDPSLALKSLPVDAVESIQLYDDQSDEAKFSGFDDGERVKAINIIVKRGVMNSTSGRASLGYGTNDRYMAGAQVNGYGDVHNFAVIAQANNANKRDFTPHSIMSGGGRGGGRSGWSDNNDLGAFNTSSWGGITETYMIGGTYAGDFEKVDVNATYFYTGSNADNWKKISQNYLTMPRDYMQADSSMGYSNSHRLNSKIEWTPNETNRFNFKINGSYTNNYGSSMMESSTFLGDVPEPSNANISNYNTRLDRYSGNASAWWQHRFAKPGRTISIGGIFKGNKDDGIRDQYSLYTSLSPDLGAMVVDTINMIGGVAASGYSAKGSVTYSEPLSEHSRLKLNYSINYDRSLSDNDGFNYDNAVQAYVIEDTTTTNYINRNYTTQLAGLGYGYNLGKDFNLNATLNYQYATLNNTQITPLYDNIAKNDSYNFQAILPSVSLKYSPKMGQNLKVDYNTNSVFPSVGQLQDALNNVNPLQVSKGNPELRQSYKHSLKLRYNLALPDKNINFNLMGMGTMTSDYIATHRKFLTADTTVNGVTLVKGAQFSTPVNLEGYRMAMVYSTFGVGIKPLSSNLNISGWYRYSHTPSIENDVEYMSVANRIGGSLSLTSNISENVDFTLAYRPSMNITKGGTGTIDRYYSHDVSAFANIIFLKYFFVNADLQWKNSFGTRETYGQHYAMLNAAVGAKFLKDRNAEVRFGVYDALDQNRSVWQWSGDTYTQITQSQVLSRYYMVTLSFKFDTRKNKRGRGGDGEGYRGGGRPPHHMM